MQPVRLFRDASRVHRLTHALQRLKLKNVNRCPQRMLSGQNSLVSHLQAKIKFNGPITVANYMKEVLTNPVSGYYIHKDVFGAAGDFTTSPEISQMFGELVGIWFINEWQQAGSPPELQLVELGPGRGTMADDMLRVFSRFPEMKKAVSLHLVEVSEKLSEMQETKLCGSQGDSGNEAEITGSHYKTRLSKYGPRVYWYRELKDVPSGYTAFVAHEFFDALPVHKFQKTEKGWCEVLVDMDTSDSSTQPLRFVLSPTKTAAATAFLEVAENDSRDHIEVCPQGGVIAQEMAARIHNDGGVALIADYGHNGEKGDTFRGFKSHKLHDVLVDPGTADLTADVDFAYLRRIVGSEVKTCGPVTQADFLVNMGIGQRLHMLLRRAGPKEQKDLLSGFNMLMKPDMMGERFKFFSILGKDITHTPAGFQPLQ